MKSMQQKSNTITIYPESEIFMESTQLKELQLKLHYTEMWDMMSQSNIEASVYTCICHYIAGYANDHVSFTRAFSFLHKMSGHNSVKWVKKKVWENELFCSKRDEVLGPGAFRDSHTAVC